MSAQTNSSTADETSPDSLVPLNVLVLYEDAYARARIEGVYGLMEDKFSEEYKIGCRWCWFDELCDPVAAKEATLAARAADLILVSADAVNEPPDRLTQWIESWIDDKADHAAALAALLVCETALGERPMPTEVYLNEIARRAEMAFMCRTIPAICGPPIGSMADMNQIPTPVPIQYKLRKGTLWRWRCDSRDTSAEKLAENGRAWGHREHWF